MVLALHNVAVHRVLPAPAGAALNLTTAFGLVEFAGRAGCSRADLGIRAQDLRSGLRVGLGAATVATGAVALGAALPATRRFFADRRVRDVGAVPARDAPGRAHGVLGASPYFLATAMGNPRRVWRCWSWSVARSSRWIQPMGHRVGAVGCG